MKCRLTGQGKEGATDRLARRGAEKLKSEEGQGVAIGG